MKFSIFVDLTHSSYNMRLLFFFIFSISSGLLSLTAQHVKIKPEQLQSNSSSAGIKSGIIQTPLFRSVDHNDPGDKWAIVVRGKSSHEHFTEELMSIKESKRLLKQNSIRPVDSNESGSRAVNPKIGINFDANWSVESTPPDNTIAISNNGYIVSANNDGIEYYNSSGTYLYFDYWSDFVSDNTLTSSIFDPKVIYDSGSDRFVMVILHGSTFTTSKVLVCFSKSNNPQNGWWIYTLTGNPLANNCWFDYPNLGVSNNEIYITGNLFKGNSFNQSVVYQIPKAAGYAGNSLDWQYWSGLSDEPFEAFTLIPASYGQQGNYGPGIYLVSNESVGAHDIRLWDLTDDLSGSPVMNSYTIATTAYSPAADALQSGSSDELDNGDCRILNAFYLNGIVHFVFHADIGDGWNGIIYNRLSVSNSAVNSSTFGLSGSYDYAYPNLASFATNENDKSVMIGFLRSSEDIFPQLRVVSCDQNMNWSESTLVKPGETFVDFLSGDERWGDYTGMARKHNSPDPRVWMAGCYGANVTSQATFNTYKTWVAEVSAGETVGVESNHVEKGISLFPNPVYDLIRITFNVVLPEEITIALYDMEGHLIRILYQDTPEPGETGLTFNKGMLSPGTYTVTFSSINQLLKNEKIIVAN